MSDVEFPQKLRFLFEPKRYKVAYGGRGAAKSWGFARALLILGASKPLRILCAREIQKSIKDSVHQLLTDQIKALGLEGFYSITNNSITGKNDTQFGFEGLKHNITNIKSWEGADICWVEEAHTVSKSSWDTLIPTIRKEGSEIWITFNPELEEDETYQRFVVSHPPDSLVIKINWNDNPWFPEVLRQEKDYLKVKDPQAYENVWEGHCKAAIEGAIFAKELASATQEGRICSVPYDPKKPVHCYFDLGFSDQAAVWFGQVSGLEFHWIRYYANSQEKTAHYIKYLKELPYAYGTIYLPHDADNEQMSADKTITRQFREAFSSVVVVPRISKKVLSVDAARSLFPMSYFDKELCADGLSCLRRYHYKVDLETGRIAKEPEHDIYSHGADAFQCAALAMRQPEKQKPKFNRTSIIRRSGVRSLA